MNIERLRERALGLYEAQQPLFARVEQQLQLSKEDIIEGFVIYNSEVETLDNDIYDDAAVRVAMYMEYNLPGSWHQQRQDVICDYLSEFGPQKIIDIGFGAPMKYVKEYVLADSKCELTLADKFDAAFELAKVVLSTWDADYSRQISFQQIDLAHIEPVKGYDAYILQDAIEHAPDPTGYLRSLVAGAPSDAIFLLSLPIGPLIPCHFISWEQDSEAVKWIDACGLKILKQEKIFVQPEVDWFAENLGDIYNLVLVATPK